MTKVEISVESLYSFYFVRSSLVSESQHLDRDVMSVSTYGYSVCFVTLRISIDWDFFIRDSFHNPSAPLVKNSQVSDVRTRLPGPQIDFQAFTSE